MNKSHIVQLIFILIILYAISSINVMLLALGILPNLPGGRFLMDILIVFALISFLLMLIVSAYHVSTMIRRKKRRTDEPARPAA